MPKELLPAYLRFVRGIIDSEDLPLNVSREILQQNRVLTSIRTASVKKILSELKNIAAGRPEQYLKFIAAYNRPLKEGLYGDFANRETLLDLVRFRSTKAEGLTSLADVKSRMKEGQKSIYYITGGTEAVLRASPLLEIYRKKDLEVLLLDDDIDEIVFSGIDKYGDIDLKAVSKSSTSEDLKDEAEPDKAEALTTADRQAESHARRSREGCTCLRAACRQSLLHRLRRRRALDEDAADATRHGAERSPCAETHARDQS